MKLKLTHKARLIFTIIAVVLLLGIAFFFTAKSGFLAFSGPTIIRVSPTGNDSNDGSSWTLAKKTIGATIATAGTSSAEIWIQKGIYQESGLEVSNNTTGLGFYGGFAGTETLKESRPIYQENSTAIDSLNQSTTLKFSNSANITIDRIALKNGKTQYNGGCLYFPAPSGLGFLKLTDVVADTCEATLYRGGALYLRGVDVSYNNLTIRNSKAGVMGGGIYTASNEFIGNGLLIEYCLAPQGGGLYAEGIGSAKIPTPAMSNSIIRNNIATSTNQYEGGGGVVLSSVQTIFFDRAFVSNNTASYGAGMILQNGTSTRISNVIVSGNTSASGAIIIRDNNTRPNMYMDTIADNTSTIGVSAIDIVLSSAAEFIGPIIAYNKAPQGRGAVGKDATSAYYYHYLIRWMNEDRTFDDPYQEEHGGWLPKDPGFLNRHKITVKDGYGNDHDIIEGPMSYQLTSNGGAVDYTSDATVNDFSGAIRPVDGTNRGKAYSDSGAFEYQGVQQHFVLTDFSGDQSSKLVQFIAKDSGGNTVGSGDLPQSSDGFFVLPAKNDSTAFKKNTGPYTFSFSADGYQTTNVTISLMPADNSIGQTVTLDPVSSNQKEYLRLYNWVGPNLDQSFPPNFKVTLTIKDMSGVTQYSGDISLGPTDLVPTSPTYRMSSYTIPNRNLGPKIGQPYTTGEQMRVCFGFLSYLTQCQNVTATSTNFFNTNFNLTGGDPNTDSHIGLTDLGLVLGDFGKTRINSDNPASDINWSLNVDLLDLGIVLNSFDTTGDTP